MNKKVVIGMSGGVDSSVAALLLKKQGYECVGVTMQIWDSSDVCRMEHEGGCCGQSAVDDARRVAAALGIPYYVVNFRDLFREKVESVFIDEYLKGRTPNPCVACNRYVKWASMLKTADNIGADFIATGHYARTEALSNGRLTVRNSVTAAKDQTYMLYGLSQEQLRRTLMPIGDYDKSEIRKIAQEAGLPVAHKPDSQEICFVPDNDYAGYIDREAGDRVPGPGRFISIDGKDLGPNRGITHYTVGQRKHLGLSMGHPVFVTEIRPETGEVVIGEDSNVYGSCLTADHLNFMAIAPEEMPIGSSRMVSAKIRYSRSASPCRITRTGEDEIRAEFDPKVRAVTPGQSIVCYEEDHVLLGGIIDRKIR